MSRLSTAWINFSTFYCALWIFYHSWRQVVTLGSFPWSWAYATWTHLDFSRHLLSGSWIWPWQNVSLSRFGGEKEPIWLISFVGIFVPGFCTSKLIVTEKAKIKAIENQRRFFRYQSLLATICYIPCLITIMAIVTMPFDTHNFTYGPNMILDHRSFVFMLTSTMAMGFVALILSWPMVCSNIRICQRSKEDQDEIDARYEDISTSFVDKAQAIKPKDCGKKTASAIIAIIILFLTFIPTFVPNQFVELPSSSLATLHFRLVILRIHVLN